MKSAYGKRRSPKPSRSSGVDQDSAPLKIKLRGRDGHPLTMRELQQGLYEAARKLQGCGQTRAKWATLYLTLVDENGEELRVNKKNEWTIYPYQSAADEHGV